MKLAALALTATCALTLSACGQDPVRNTTAAPTVPAGPDRIQSEIAAMNDGQRNGVLFRAISDAGQKCQGIETSARQEDRDGQPTWVAKCVAGDSWLVAIGPGGNAKVTGPVAPAKTAG